MAVCKRLSWYCCCGRPRLQVQPSCRAPFRFQLHNFSRICNSEMSTLARWL